MKTKQDMRKYTKDLFHQQDKEELDLQDKKISENIIEYIVKHDVQNICIYENMDDEVWTLDIIKKLENLGKSIYVPQMISETEMILIEKDDYEIYEDSIDIFIIPGRAFTRTWKRLGRGKWYYDRLLSDKKYKSSQKIGICYNFQIWKDIPCEKHDIKMDKIISSKI